MYCTIYLPWFYVYHVISMISFWRNVNGVVVVDAVCVTTLHRYWNVLAQIETVARLSF